MVLGNRFVRRVTTEVNTVGAASLMKETEPNSQHLFSGMGFTCFSLFSSFRERERKKRCRSSLLPTLGPVGIHNHLLPPHNSDKQENKNTDETLSVARNR